MFFLWCCQIFLYIIVYIGAVILVLKKLPKSFDYSKYCRTFAEQNISINKI